MKVKENGDTSQERTKNSKNNNKTIRGAHK